MNEKNKTALKIILPLIVALLSICVVSKYAASPEFHKKTIETLDAKKTTVMELTAASTAASAAITLLPGDTATPIATKLADLSSYFLLVVCAIYLEKYLVTITGYAAFVFLIPAACVLLSLHAFLKNNVCKQLAIRLITFALISFIAIPASVSVSNLIENTYRASIQDTITSAKETTEQIEENTKASDEDSSGSDENKGIISGIISKVQDTVSAVTATAADFENVLNNFIEALAVMLVTSCLIPILVLLFFVWLAKLLLTIDPDWPRKGLKPSGPSQTF